MLSITARFCPPFWDEELRLSFQKAQRVVVGGGDVEMACGLWLSRHVFAGLVQGSPLPIGLLQLAAKNAAKWVEVVAHTRQRHCGGHTFPARSSLVCGMHEASCSLQWHEQCKGWWDTDFLQRNAQEEGLLFNDA